MMGARSSNDAGPSRSARRLLNSYSGFWFIALVVISFLACDGDAFSWRKPLHRSASMRFQQQRVASVALGYHHPTRNPLTVLYSNVYRAVEGTGVPSSRGWKKSGRLDRLSDWSVAEESNRPIICEYEPNAFWLWTKWSGTVLQLTFKSVLVTVIMGAVIDYWARSVSTVSWPLIAVPPPTDPLITSLEGLRKMWGYQLTLGTFVLTFFASQAYNYWKKMYFTARAIQGRINDICMLLTIGAERGSTDTHSIGSTGYSNRASKLVNLCTRLIRVRYENNIVLTVLTVCERHLLFLLTCLLVSQKPHLLLGGNTDNFQRLE